MAWLLGLRAFLGSFAPVFWFGEWNLDVSFLGFGGLQCWLLAFRQRTISDLRGVAWAVQ